MNFSAQRAWQRLGVPAPNPVFLGVLMRTKLHSPSEGDPFCIWLTVDFTEGWAQQGKLWESALCT